MFGRLYEKLDANLKVQDERHDRTMEVLNDILNSLKALRETQIAVRKNGNGNGAARAAATVTKKAALPAGYGGAGAAIAYLLQHFLGG